MKRALSLTIFVVCGLGYALWIFLKVLERHQTDSLPQAAYVEKGDVSLGGAPYPDDLWTQLEHRKHEVEITKRPANAIPAGIEWERGGLTPELGDDAAVRGGTVRLHNVGPFPANFLAFGSPTPQFFHYSLFERLEIPLVERHPRTGEPVQGLADRWFQQGKTVWFHLNPLARYSNGQPVRAGDFALGALLRSRCSNDSEWAMLTQAVKSVRIYGDEYIAVTLRNKCPVALFLASAVLHPAEPGFYAEFGSDYTTRYADRIPPTTGAYVVTKVETGRLIRLERQPKWWAETIPQRAHTCNVDAIEHHFLADEAQAWEVFLRGGLDAIQTRNMAAWQQKLEGVPAVEEGRIRKHSIYVDYPLPPYGIAINTETVPDLRLRQGLLWAVDMDAAINAIFRGEATRLTTFDSGYGAITPYDTPHVSYNPKNARDMFAVAGYTEQGPDGILRKKDGTRLSLKFTYTPSDKTSTLFTHLAQSAKACGLELVPDPEPWQNIADKVKSGTHELLFWAASPSTLMPQPERFLHSTAQGTDAPFRLHSEAMDAALKECYTAATTYDLAQACSKVDRLVFNLAIWIPGWKEDRAHIATWKHLHLPFRYCGPYDVMEAHTFWISDDAMDRAPDKAPGQAPE